MICKVAIFVPNLSYIGTTGGYWRAMYANLSLASAPISKTAFLNVVLLQLGTPYNSGNLTLPFHADQLSTT